MDDDDVDDDDEVDETDDGQGDGDLSPAPPAVGGGPSRNPLARTQKRNFDESAPLERSSPRNILTMRSAFRRAIVFVLAASPYVCVAHTEKKKQKKHVNESQQQQQQQQQPARRPTRR